MPTCAYCTQPTKRATYKTCGDSECKRQCRNERQRNLQRKYRAAGLPVDHYRSKAERTCAECGTTYRGSRTSTCCSVKCGALLASRASADSAALRRNERRLPVLYTGLPGRRMQVALKRATSATGTRSNHAPWATGRCDICRRWFMAKHRGRSTAKTCSAECDVVRAQELRREAKHTRRARQRDAFVEPVNRRRVYERDQWRCHLCGQRVKRNAVAPHPMSATIDHVIPLAKGGTHEPANVATAHFICNSRKGDRSAGEQLALIG